MDSKTYANNVLNAYKKWVMQNPGRATEVETMVKWLSYFVAGKVNNSPIFSEFIYSVSNLFSLYNDILIRKANNEVDCLRNTAKDRLKLWLTILHYCEVFMELASRGKWGNRGKWSAATVIQIVRCMSNLILVYKYNETPVLQPPMSQLQRPNMNKDNNPEVRNEGFTLKRSGRVIRRIEAAPPIPLRNWKPITNVHSESIANNISGGDVQKKKLAETLYIIKPLIHLGSVACFGPEAWKQWLLSLGLDLASLRLYSEELESLSFDQRLEIYRRKLSMILYLLRSPMYQRHSSHYINRLLKCLSARVPLMSIICNPILQYMPHWQDTYFYMWPN